MPKRIPDLEKQILAAAREGLMSRGYKALSMRGLARQCGIAVGTLYNYFRSKEALVASVTLEDWQHSLSLMDRAAGEADTLTGGLTGLCRVLMDFTGQYREVWEQYGPGGRAVGFTAKYHLALRRQLSAPIAAVLRRVGRQDLLPLGDVLAEAMLACALNTDLGDKTFGLLASSWEPSGNM